MNTEEKTQEFINGFLKNLDAFYTLFAKYHRMLFDMACKRTYEENLKSIMSNPMTRTASRTREGLEKEILADIIFLSPEEKLECTGLHMKPEDYVCARIAANQKNRQNFREMFGKLNFIQGNCTAIPMVALMNQPNNPLKGWSFADPRELIQVVKKTHPDFIYETDENNNFFQLFFGKNIQKGALLILNLDRTTDDFKGCPPDNINRGHMLVCTGFDEKQYPLFISFDSEHKNYSLSSRRQCGYVIDLAKILKYEFDRKEKIARKNNLLKSNQNT